MHRSYWAWFTFGGLVALAACANGPGPGAAEPAAPEPRDGVETSNETAEQPAPLPAPGSAEPTDEPAPVAADDGPVIDCSKYPAGKPPDVHWLCELAMATSRSA